MKVEIVPAALDELHAATAFYVASADVALARAFMAEFERALELIAGSPNLGSPFNGSRRRYPMRRFPYSLIYQLTPDALRVVAVAHQRRRPGYWKSRK
jgi:toxin ParE1/3/4